MGGRRTGIPPHEIRLLRWRASIAPRDLRLGARRTWMAPREVRMGGRRTGIPPREVRLLRSRTSIAPRDIRPGARGIWISPRDIRLGRQRTWTPLRGVRLCERGPSIRARDVRLGRRRPWFPLRDIRLERVTEWLRTWRVRLGAADARCSPRRFCLGAPDRALLGSPDEVACHERGAQCTEQPALHVALGQAEGIVARQRAGELIVERCDRSRARPPRVRARSRRAERRAIVRCVTERSSPEGAPRRRRSACSASNAATSSCGPQVSQLRAEATPTGIVPSCTERSEVQRRQ